MGRNQIPFGDDPLDEHLLTRVLAPRHRRIENDDFPAVRIPEVVRQLVDQDPVVDVQRVRHGRRRHVIGLQNKGPRNIDIDILIFGDTILDSPQLTIPHPAMPHRRFVLEPLAEISPDVLHPVLKKTIRELRDALPQGQVVRKVDGNC